jgi:hypothetical protein
MRWLHGRCHPQQWQHQDQRHFPSPNAGKQWHSHNQRCRLAHLQLILRPEHLIDLSHLATAPADPASASADSTTTDAATTAATAAATAAGCELCWQLGLVGRVLTNLRWRGANANVYHINCKGGNWIQLQRVARY